MTIRILEVDKADYSPVDVDAYKTAEKWLNRIPELFITERSMQRQIGISEVGSDCRKCVARKLALVYKKPEGSWFPFIGTAVHDALEKGFASRWDDEYLLENKLHVHSYKDLELAGSCDMSAFVDGKKCDCTDPATCSGPYCDPTLVVNDWKVVGERTLKEASKGKIKNQYRIQAMLYGLGWVKKGYKVTHVALTFLPRDKDLAEAEVVMLRYDEQIAFSALAEIEVMIDAAEIAGWDAVITRATKASFCYDCKKYEQAEDGDVNSLVASFKQ
jgi:hypothetical protein